MMLLVGLAQGQDYNYDLMNYHFASAHLLVAGALDRDVAPSGVQSWFNPIGYVPVMLAIKTLPPLLVSALLAIAAGLNAPLIYAVADRVAAGLPEPHRRHAALACTLIGMTGAITRSEAATSFLDNILSIAELAALLAAIRAVETGDAKDQARATGWSGLFLGIATGLKLTAGIFALAIAGALLLAVARRRIGIAPLLALAVGGVLGFLPTGGWWAWHLWRDFGNPVFPMANDIFHSPWAPSRPLNDTSFQPRGWADIFAEPWHWLIGDRTPGAEIAIRDPRYAVGLAAAVLAVTPMPGRRRGAAANGEAGTLVAASVLLFYGVWLFAFGILRYAVLIEMLGGVAPLAVLVRVRSIGARAIGIGMLAAALIAGAWTRSESWGRVPFTGDWFGVQGIAAVHQPGTLYVMSDDAPLAFMVAIFPADARFVHIGGNFPLDPATGLGRRAADMIRQATVLRTLTAAPSGRDGERALRRFGLVQVPGSCRPIPTKRAQAESCLLQPSR